MYYRRAILPAGTFFFTLVMHRRRPILTSNEAVDVLHVAIRSVSQSRPFHIDAMVVMPDQLHCIWTVSSGDGDFSTRWRLIKTAFTRHCQDTLRSTPDAARQKKREQAVWQHRYWEHQIRDEADYRCHVDYIHYITVKHGLVQTALDWPLSCFGRYVRAGVYAPDWGSSSMCFEGIGREWLDDGMSGFAARTQPTPTDTEWRTNVETCRRITGSVAIGLCV